MSSKAGVIAFKSGEWLSYSAGVLLTGFFLVQIAQGEVQRQAGVEQFELVAQASQASAEPAATGPDAAAVLQQQVDELSDPDTTLWNAARVDDYQASLSADLPEVLGVLEVPSVGLKVPVYSTNTDLVMDRGAGIIDGMSYPHEPGNIGISGHRDGYFRVLKDVKVGDPIVVQSLEGPKRFRIDAIHIVPIKDETLLRDTRDQTVTLVTCYPFYFVGTCAQTIHRDSVTRHTRCQPKLRRI